MQTMALHCMGQRLLGNMCSKLPMQVLPWVQMDLKGSLVSWLHTHNGHTGRHNQRVCATSPGEVGPRRPKKGSKTIEVHDSPKVLMEEDVDEDSEIFPAEIMDAVVKVYCIHTEPNFSLPWQRKRQYTSTSSGFVVIEKGQRWLLTNAHSVDYNTQVKVKKRGDDRKFLARVLSLGVDCDVALLSVDEDEFWSGLEPIKMAGLPRLQDRVAVVGYPIGGDTISITAGVVSRIEVTQYSHAGIELLTIQIDAAINGGNSGGPVFNTHGQCVGIAFQALTGDDVENVGYVIPTPVVNHFLTDYRTTKQFTGFPAVGIHWQRTESDALRRVCKMKSHHKGVLIRAINPTSAVAGILQPDDVLMAFDGIQVANDGTVPFRTGERIAFNYLISQKFVGDQARVKVLRQGEEIELSIELSKPHTLVPAHISNRDPPYFIVAGLVFTAVSEKYLESEYGMDWGTEAPVRLLEKILHGMPARVDEEVVVLSQVLASNATLGYEEIHNVQVKKFNGEDVKNLRHLAELVASNTEAFMRFDMDYHEIVVMESALVASATEAVLLDHSITHAMSPELRKALPAWPTVKQ